MGACLRLLEKDLRLMKNWMLGSTALLVVVGLLCVWIAYMKPSGVTAVLMTGLLYIHVFYIPIYLWNSLAKEWKGTYVYWLQVPQSGWTLLAMKLVSAVIGLSLSYLITFGFFYGTAQLEIKDSPAIFQSMVGSGDFDPIYYTRYIQHSFLSLFTMILYVSVSIGLWFMLLNISIQAVRRRLQRFSGFAMFILFALLFWGEMALANTQFYKNITSWGSFHGGSVWSIVEMTVSGILYDLVFMGIFFFLAGWLLDRKVEV